MKLQQGQVWKTGEDYLRIVHLERLEVKYKSMKDLARSEGEHHHVTKKQFCRLIKDAVLIDSKDAKANAAHDPTPQQTPAENPLP